MIDTREADHIGIIKPISPLTNAPLDMEIFTRPVRELEADETGGLELFIDMLGLSTKQDAETQMLPVITATAPEASEAPVAPDERPAGGFLRRALGRVKAAISQAVKTIREAVGWLTSDMQSPQALVQLKAWHKRASYKGTRNVQRAWFGRQLSTAQAVRVTRSRHTAAQQTSTAKEGALSSYYQLPEYWVSHLAQLIQVVRDHEDSLRAVPGRHFVCR